MKCHASDKTQGWDTLSETAHAQLAVPLEKASWDRLTVGLKTRKILSLLFFKAGSYSEGERSNGGGQLM